jgi:hypothetical protein
LPQSRWSRRQPHRRAVAAGMVAADSTAVDSMVAVAGMAAASAVDFAVLE